MDGVECVFCFDPLGLKLGTAGAEGADVGTAGAPPTCLSFGIPPLSIPASCAPTGSEGSGAVETGGDGCAARAPADLDEPFDWITPPPPVIGLERSFVTAFFSDFPLRMALRRAFLSGVTEGSLGGFELD